jgi:hypothetical protein
VTIRVATCSQKGRAGKFYYSFYTSEKKYQGAPDPEPLDGALFVLRNVVRRLKIMRP